MPNSWTAIRAVWNLPQEAVVAARMQDIGRQSSVHMVKSRAFKKVLSVLENPPKPSQELIDMIARGRALRNSQ